MTDPVSPPTKVFSDVEFSKTDLDGDGKITRDELRARAERDNVGKLSEMVRESRQDQMIVSSRVQELKNANADSHQASLSPRIDAARQAQIQEIAALRRQLAGLDAAVVERDAEIEALNTKAVQMEGALRELQMRAAGAATWQERYEEAQRLSTAKKGNIRDMQEDKLRRLKDIALLTQRARIFETSGKIAQSHIERLEVDGASKGEQHFGSDVQRQERAEQVLQLEDGFVRFIGRVTTSLASGVLTAVVKDGNSAVRFVTLSLAQGGSSRLNIYEEPHALYEMVSLRLTREDAEVDFISAGLIKFATHDVTVVLGFTSDEELTNWVGALYLADLCSNQKPPAKALRSNTLQVG